MTAYSEHIVIEGPKECRISNNVKDMPLYYKDNATSKTKNIGDNRRCRNRLHRYKTHIKSVVGSIRNVLVLPAIIGWLIWLTFMILDNQTPQQLQKARYSLPIDAEYGGMIQSESHRHTSSSSAVVDSISGFTGVLDINSLFDETSSILQYLPSSSRLNMISNVTQINQDGSFRILKAGRYLVHSKLALTNEFTRTKSFRQCILLTNDESLECDQGSVSHRKKRTSHIIRFDYFEQNQTLKVIMTNKALVYRDPLYNKIEIMRLVLN